MSREPPAFDSVLTLKPALIMSATVRSLLPSPRRWAARTFGSGVLTPVLLLAVVAATQWGLAASLGSSTALWRPVLLTLILVGSACAALSWIRPQRAGLSPPHVMLSLGFGGMVLGFAFDLAQAGPQRLEALCLQSNGLGYWAALHLHLAFLPGMHAGMLAGGLLAIPSLRALHPGCGRYLCSLFTQNLLCSGWMLMGMTAGALLAARSPGLLEAGATALPGMIGGMFVGMAWGMVVSVALYRGCFLWRSRRHTGEGLPS